MLDIDIYKCTDLEIRFYILFITFDILLAYYMLYRMYVCAYKTSRCVLSWFLQDVILKRN